MLALQFIIGSAGNEWLSKSGIEVFLYVLSLPFIYSNDLSGSAAFEYELRQGRVGMRDAQTPVS